MERIQSAIAKARALRQEATKKPAPDIAEKAPESSSDASVAAAWAALTEASIHARNLEANRIVSFLPGPESAPFDLMRTNLMSQLREKKWTRVAITSPGSNCGKTTVCLNLAFSLARQSELRVIVLEMDLRRPSMMRTLGMSGDWQFSSVLEETTLVKNQLARWRQNLAFGLNAFATDNPAELLSSARAAHVIDAIEAEYKPDVILFDMPPVLVSDDTIAFMDQVDCALMVVAAEKSKVKEIDRCGTELAAHTQVLGVALNKCRFMSGEEGYDAYY